jgi:hypothetical protein
MLKNFSGQLSAFCAVAHIGLLFNGGCVEYFSLRYLNTKNVFLNQ